MSGKQCQARKMCRRKNQLPARQQVVVHLLKGSSQTVYGNAQACYKLAAAPWMLHEA